jgi:hypothetical protein
MTTDDAVGAHLFRIAAHLLSPALFHAPSRPESPLPQSRNDRRNVWETHGAYTCHRAKSALGEHILRAPFMVESEMELSPWCIVGRHRLVRRREISATTALPATEQFRWQHPV